VIFAFEANGFAGDDWLCLRAKNNLCKIIHFNIYP
jgi:hypothetical protein